MLLSDRRLAHNKEYVILPHIRYTTHESPGNRRIHALGNPRNGMRISDARLQHLTLCLL